VVHATLLQLLPAHRQKSAALATGKGAIAFRVAQGSHNLRWVNGVAGVVLAPGGRLSRVLRFTFSNGKIARIDVVADPASLRQLDLAVLDD